MNNEKKQDEEVEKSTLQNKQSDVYDKCVVAAYANVAQLQFQTGIRYLQAKVDGKELGDFSDKFITDLYTVGNLKKCSNLIELTEKILPFLRHFNDMVILYDDKSNKKVESYKLIESKKIEHYGKILSMFYSLLDDIRNYHTHTKHNEIYYQGIMAYGVVNLEKCTKEYVEKNGEYKFDDPKFRGKTIINHLYDSSFQLLKTRFPLTKFDVAELNRYCNGKSAKLKKSRVPKHYLLSYKQDYLLKLTQYGIVFFVNLFLSKEYSNLFLSQVTGFKSSNKKVYRMIRELYSINPLRLPKEKVSWHGSMSSNILDALNELMKIPSTLREHISPEDFKNYIRSIEEKEITEEYEDAVDEQGNEYSLSTTVRYRNRFEEFALSMLPYLVKCKDIYFYTYLGKVYKKCYPKNLIDGTLEPHRYISENLCGFTNSLSERLEPEQLEGCLLNKSKAYCDSSTDQKYKCVSELNVRLTSKEQEDVNSEDFKPYVSYAYPHYIINNNKIGIYIREEEDDKHQENKNIYPDLYYDGDNLKHHLPKMTCWISIYDLPALVYFACETVTKGGSMNLKDKIIKQIKEISSGEAVKNYEIKSVDVQKLKDDGKFKKEYKKKATDINELKINRINDYIKQTHDEIDFIEIHPRKDGVMADKLLHDILWLQPSKKGKGGKDKVTSPNAQVIQRSLAQFHYYRNNLYRIFTQAGLIGGENPHPFLAEMMTDIHDIESLNDFYSIYLSKKKSFLKKQNKLLKKKRHLSFTVQHLLRGLEVKSGTRALPNGADFVFTLPHRFLMDDLIRFCKYKDQRSLFYLLKGMNSQKFYSLGRYYSFFLEGREKVYYSLEERKNRLEGESKKTLKENDSEKYLKYKKLLDTEGELRRHELQDKVLFHLIKTLFNFNWTVLGIATKKSSKVKFDFGLEDVTDSSSCLNLQVPVNLEYICSEKLKIKHKKLIVKHICKIKDYGSLKLVLSSLKMSSLLNYCISNGFSEIMFESLLKESSDFEIDRVKIIEKSQELEKAVIDNKDKLGIELNTENSGGYYNFTGILEKLLKTNILTLGVKEDLRFIRNMYSHSQYKLELLESKEFKGAYGKFTNNDYKEEYPKDKPTEGDLCISHKIQMYYAKTIHETIESIFSLIKSNA